MLDTAKYTFIIIILLMQTVHVLMQSLIYSDVSRIYTCIAKQTFVPQQKSPCAV